MTDHTTLDMLKINPKKHYSKKKTRAILSSFINDKGKINTQITRVYFVEKHNLMSFFESLFFHTSYLLHNAHIRERYHGIYYLLSGYHKCICGNEMTKFHGSSYKDFGYGKYCSHRCNGVYQEAIGH